MGAPIAMPTNDQILTLTQWFSPAYPVGAFAYSHGLEWAVESGVVANIAGLEDWLTDIVQHGAGLADVRFLVAAYRAADGDEIAEIDAVCRAFAPSKERLMETGLQGVAFCKVTAEIWGQELPDLCYPVAVGRAANLAQLPLGLTAGMFLQAIISNLVAAAQRLLPIGQTDGQRLIQNLSPCLLQVADIAVGGSLNDLSGTAFLSDIASMKHETQYSRIFRT